MKSSVPEGSLQTSARLGSSVKVLYKFLKGPLSAEGSLDLDTCLFALSEEVHDRISSTFETESLLDSDNYGEELLRVLHNDFFPTFVNDVRENHRCDFFAS